MLLPSSASDPRGLPILGLPELLDGGDPQRSRSLRDLLDLLLRGLLRKQLPDQRGELGDLGLEVRNPAREVDLLDCGSFEYGSGGCRHRNRNEFPLVEVPGPLDHHLWHPAVWADLALLV